MGFHSIIFVHKKLCLFERRRFKKDNDVFDGCLIISTNGLPKDGLGKLPLLSLKTM